MINNIPICTLSKILLLYLIPNTCGIVVVLKIAIANGIQAIGHNGLNSSTNGPTISCAVLDVPINNPKGTQKITAIENPHTTLNNETIKFQNNDPVPISSLKGFSRINTTGFICGNNAGLFRRIAELSQKISNNTGIIEPNNIL